LRRVATRDFDQEAMEWNLAGRVAELESALAPRWASVYLHCTAGIKRLPTVAAAYVLRTQGLSAQQACARVTAWRHCNPYGAVLERYESLLKAP